MNKLEVFPGVDGKTTKVYADGSSEVLRRIQVLFLNITCDGDWTADLVIGRTHHLDRADLVHVDEVVFLSKPKDVL